MYLSIPGKNSADVRSILESLVTHGAPDKILVDGKPHLGTDKLIVILRNIRAYLVQQGESGTTASAAKCRVFV